LRELQGVALRVDGILTRVLGLCLLVSACLCSSAGAAKRPPVPKTTPEYEALFKRMYDNPADVDLTFEFAAMATKLGDYEAAASALERILMFNPNLPRVKLQLGQLYFKLGSYKMARAYFDQAREPPAPEDVRTDAAKFLAALQERQEPRRVAQQGPRTPAAMPQAPRSPHIWSFFGQTGLRYQTNANAGPSGALIRSLSQNAFLSDNFVKRGDWNAFALFGASYIYDLQRGNEDSIETLVVGYYARQFALEQFNFGLLEVQSGPRFSVPNLTPHTKATSIRVYGIGTGSTLADQAYFVSGGAGLSVRFILDNLTVARIEPLVEYRQRKFYDSGPFPTSSQQTGGLTTVAVRSEGTLFGRLPWFGRAAFDRTDMSDNRYSYLGYDRLSADIGFPIPFALPWFDNTIRQYVVTPVAGASYTEFGQANPDVDALVVRKDREWRGGLIFDAQIYERYGIRTQFSYTSIDSNLPNYKLQNYSISFGPTARF
jgi:tetratricopeptide (TPR) repeat protein